jgi:hypothetical protein
MVQQCATPCSTGQLQKRKVHMTVSIRGDAEPLVDLTEDELPPLREAMRDLQLSVAAYYTESARGGDLGPRVRNFLVSAQTLNDLLTNEIEHSQLYRALFTDGRHAAADLIDAVKFARNVTQHVLHILKPSDDRVLVGGLHGMRFYAVWDSIPSSVVAKLRSATQKLEPAYKATLEGHDVTKTMMAVLRFYAEVAPAIVHRDARNEWTGFPLLSQPGMNTPIHPEEPADMDASKLWMNQRPPGGDCRVVCGQATIDGTSYVFGHTFLGRVSFAPFFETINQMKHDIELGFPYFEGVSTVGLEDVTDEFPDARQGTVLASPSEPATWAIPIAHFDARPDWHLPGMDIDWWVRRIELQNDTRMPAGFHFGPRRAQRLNALVPPR